MHRMKALFQAARLIRATWVHLIFGWRESRINIAIIVIIIIIISVEVLGDFCWFCFGRVSTEAKY